MHCMVEAIKTYSTRGYFYYADTYYNKLNVKCKKVADIGMYIVLDTEKL